jgi:1-deoxy-D-xylulose-5-phosphate reductoisomerase
VAVSAFLEGNLRYTAIPQVIEQALSQAPAMQADSLDTVLEADRNARRIALDCVATLMGKAA